MSGESASVVRLGSVDALKEYRQRGRVIVISDPVNDSAGSQGRRFTTRMRLMSSPTISVRRSRRGKAGTGGRQAWPLPSEKARTRTPVSTPNASGSRRLHDDAAVR